LRAWPAMASDAAGAKVRAFAHRREVTMPTTSVRVRLLTITALCLAPIVVFAVGLAIEQAGRAGDTLTAAAWIAAAAMPLIVGICGIAAVSVAAEVFIVRWLVYLERIADAYAGGHYGVRPNELDEAPSEIRWLGDAVASMAGSVQQRDQALRSALDEKTLLLREVHHRVKNNLQIVGSLLSLQGARSTTPQVRAALTEALTRIDAMALAQRFTHDAEPGDVVDAKEFFAALVAQLYARLANGERRIQIDCDITPAQIDPDQAAPFALIAVEAVLLAYQRPSPGDLLIDLSLEGDSDGARLVVRAANDTGAFSDKGAAISTDLLNGYARQLHATLDRTSEPGALTVVTGAALAA
jgi:two-component sensor histidine kinase